jgi:hypothetical protein
VSPQSPFFHCAARSVAAKRRHGDFVSNRLLKKRDPNDRSSYFYEGFCCQALPSFRTCGVLRSHRSKPLLRPPSRPPTRAGPAQAADPQTTTGGPTPITDESWRLRVRRSRWLPRHFYPCRWPCPGHQRLIREAWERAPLLHCGSQVNPVRFAGRSHQLIGPTTGVPSDLDRFQLRAIRDHACFQRPPERY